MGYVSLLTRPQFSATSDAVTGIHLFGRHRPEHLARVSAALISLFQMITLDNWRRPVQLSPRGVTTSPATIFFRQLYSTRNNDHAESLHRPSSSMICPEMHVELDAQIDAGRAIAEKGTILCATSPRSSNKSPLFSSLNWTRSVRSYRRARQLTDKTPARFLEYEMHSAPPNR